MATTFWRRSPAQAARAAIASGLLLLSNNGCRSQPLNTTLLSEHAVRLDIPAVRQDALYDCGLASISALCQYWSVELLAADREALATSAVQHAGLSGEELCSALDRAGLETYLFRGTLDHSVTGLYGQIDAGRPLLVMLSTDGDHQHYELVLGYDETGGRLILLDPNKGEILTPISAFDLAWARCQRFTLLASRRADMRNAGRRSTNTYLPSTPATQQGTEHMLTSLCSRTLALAFVAPSIAMTPLLTSPQRTPLTPIESVTLRSSIDSTLGVLSAGARGTPLTFTTSERAQLGAAQHDSPALGALRGGFAPTNNEWTWLAIGAGIVLLVILL